MKLMDRTLGKNVGVVRTCYWVGRGPHPAGPGQGGESGEKLYFNESFHQQRVERPPAQPSPASLAQPSPAQPSNVTARMMKLRASLSMAA